MMETFNACSTCGGICKTVIYNNSTSEESSICFSCGKRSSYIISRNNDIIIDENTGELILEEDMYKEGYGLVAYTSTDPLAPKQIGVYAFNEEQTFEDVFNYIQYLKKNETDKKILYATLLYKDELYTVYGKSPMLYQKNIDRYIHVLGVYPILEGISFSEYLNNYYHSSTIEDSNVYNYIHSRPKRDDRSRSKSSNNSNNSTIASTRSQLRNISEDLCGPTNCNDNYCNHL